MREHLRKQFNVRSPVFDGSASWITDKRLIQAHVALAGKPSGPALDLCCGTGQIGQGLKANGWDVTGLDLSDNMLRASSRHFRVSQGSAEEMPFAAGSFSLVTCRQTFQFLDGARALSEVRRVLKPGGVFIISLTVPFSEEDRDWLCEIHSVKQPLLLKFYTSAGLLHELGRAGFSVTETKTLKVRESINNWMAHAPELSSEVKNKVISMVGDAPQSYKKLHNVETVSGEVFEDWHWVVFKAVVR